MPHRRLLFGNPTENNNVSRKRRLEEKLEMTLTAASRNDAAVEELADQRTLAPNYPPLKDRI